MCVLVSLPVFLKFVFLEWKDSFSMEQTPKCNQHLLFRLSTQPLRRMRKHSRQTSMEKNRGLSASSVLGPVKKVKYKYIQRLHSGTLLHGDEETYESGIIRKTGKETKKRQRTKKHNHKHFISHPLPAILFAFFDYYLLSLVASFL